jgi:hypothetical protein
VNQRWLARGGSSRRPRVHCAAPRPTPRYPLAPRSSTRARSPAHLRRPQSGSPPTKSPLTRATTTAPAANRCRCRYYEAHPTWFARHPRTRHGRPKTTLTSAYGATSRPWAAPLRRLGQLSPVGHPARTLRGWPERSERRVRARPRWRVDPQHRLRAWRPFVADDLILVVAAGHRRFRRSGPLITAGR